MLKRVPISEARIGMHVQRLDGRWLDLTLLRRRFDVETAHNLA